MTITNDPQQQQPPPSASENWAMKIAKAKEAREAGRIMRSAPSTGATAGGVDLEEIRAEWSGFDPAGDPAVQQVHWLIAEIDSLRAELTTLRSDLAHAQAELKKYGDVLEWNIEQRLKLEREVDFLSTTNTVLQNERNGLSAELAERDSHLATLQAVVEGDLGAIEDAIQVLDMYEWSALSEPRASLERRVTRILAAVDQAQPQQENHGNG